MIGELITRAIITGLMASAMLAVVGSFAVQKGLSLLGDATSHITFAGIALGYILGVVETLLAYPIAVASIFGMLWVSRTFKLKGDQVLAMFLTLGAATASITIALSGARVNLMSTLFGSILAVSWYDLILTSIILVFSLAFLVSRFRELFLYLFNEEVARLRGIRTGAYAALTSLLLALTIVTAIKLIGVLMVTAFLVLPEVAASSVARSFKSSLSYSVVISASSFLMGVVLSLILDLPLGSSSVVFLTITTFAILAYGRIKGYS